jgi:predicted RNA-binding Zn ribbon-like protein
MAGGGSPRPQGRLVPVRRLRHLPGVAHTGGEGQYAVFETLHEPADLGEWLAQPPLAAAVTVPVTARELAAAKALRRAIWDAAHARAACRPLSAGAAAAPLVPELATDSTTTGWASPVRGTQALSTLAREIIELLSGPHAARIRECASDNCPLVFVDSSRHRHKLGALRTPRATDS